MGGGEAQGGGVLYASYALLSHTGGRHMERWCCRDLPPLAQHFPIWNSQQKSTVSVQCLAMVQKPGPESAHLQVRIQV